MIVMLIAQLVSLARDLCAINHRSERHKDLQILLLRQQLRILQRPHPPSPRVSPWEKFTLALLAHKLAHLSQRAKGKLDQTVLLFQPATLLKWHHDLVRRQWTFKQQPFIPRHKSDPEGVDLLLRLVRENPSWGYSRLHASCSNSAIRSVALLYAIFSSGSMYRQRLRALKGTVIGVLFLATTKNNFWLATSLL
jgi:hypothetical protein